MVQTASLKGTHAFGQEFDSAARLSKRSGSVLNCQLGHAFKRSGINRKICRSKGKWNCFQVSYKMLTYRMLFPYYLKGYELLMLCITIYLLQIGDSEEHYKSVLIVLKSQLK